MATLDDRPRTARRARLATLVAVVGPGLLAGLSDDDPAGITTYSVLGADYGYQLLWVLLLSTIALVLFHDLAARMGVATGQGLLGLVRDRYGVRIGGLALAVLVVANFGTACAEFAGVAAGFELFGVSRHVSVPIAAVLELSHAKLPPSASAVPLSVRRIGMPRLARVLVAWASSPRRILRAMRPTMAPPLTAKEESRV